MKPDHSSLIRGLNIAAVVLAALSLISCAIGFAVIEANKVYLYDAVADEYYSSYDYYYDDYWDDYYDDLWDDDYWYDDHGYSSPHHSSTGIHHASFSAPAATPVASSYYDDVYGVQDAWAALDITLAIVNALLIWEIIVSIAALVFGILGLVNAGKPQKLKSLVVFGIVGAVASFLGGHIILVVLFIISAVMASKDKNALVNAGSVPAAYPGAPVAAPVAPVAPAVPAAPAAPSAVAASPAPAAAPAPTAADAVPASVPAVAVDQAPVPAAVEPVPTPAEAVPAPSADAPAAAPVETPQAQAPAAAEAAAPASVLDVPYPGTTEPMPGEPK